MPLSQSRILLRSYFPSKFRYSCFHGNRDLKGANDPPPRPICIVFIPTVIELKVIRTEVRGITVNDRYYVKYLSISQMPSSCRILELLSKSGIYGVNLYVLRSICHWMSQRLVTLVADCLHSPGPEGALFYQHHFLTPAVEGVWKLRAVEGKGETRPL